MNNLQVPAWGIWVMLVGLAVFLVLLLLTLGLHVFSDRVIYFLLP